VVVPQPTPGYALFGRLVWMLLGPMALLLMTIAVLSVGSGWLTAADFGYFAALAAMCLGRCLEFRGGDPQTSTGQPATRQHLWRYLAGAGAFGLAVWVVANLVANR
jgi:hypothetical protein